MTAGVDVALMHAAIRLRRYGIDIALRRHLTLGALIAVVGVLMILAGAAGVVEGAGHPASAQEISASAITSRTVLLSAVAALVAQLVVAAPTHHLRLALDSMRSWQLPAASGVSVRAFVWGRYLLVEAAKSATVVALFLSFTTGLILTSSPSGGPWLGVAVGAAANVALAAARGAWVMRTTTRRVAPGHAGRRLVRLAGGVLLVALASGVLTLAWTGASTDAVTRLDAVVDALTGGPTAVVVSSVVAASALGVAARGHHGLGDLAWARVWDAVLERRTTLVSSPTLPSGALSAVWAVDARRLSRSRSERLRPVFRVLGGVPLILLVVGAGIGLSGAEVELPADWPRLPVIAGSVAFVGYAACVTCSSMLAMDADRHALTLWQTIPHGVRVVARGRAVQGALLIFLSSAAATAAAQPAFGLSAWECWVCLLAGATMAVFGVVIELVASLLWPHVEWTDPTEIGTSSPGRYAVSFLVGVPVTAVLAALGGTSLPANPAAVILSAAALALAVPLLAAALMSFVLRCSPRRLHA